MAGDAGVEGLLAARVDAPGLHEHLCNVVLSLQIPSDTPIVDLGCGTGAWLDRLARLGFSNLLGIDSDIAQFGADGVECVAYDLEQELPPLERGPFRLVTAIEVVEHIANKGTFVNTVGRLLSDDGYALLTTPNVHSLASRMRFFLTGGMHQFDRRGEPTHLTPVELTSFCRVLNREGLEVQRSWTFPEREAGQIFRPALRLLTGVVRLFLQDPLPGHVLCLLVRKSKIDSSRSLPEALAAPERMT